MGAAMMGITGMLIHESLTGNPDSPLGRKHLTTPHSVQDLSPSLRPRQRARVAEVVWPRRPSSNYQARLVHWSAAAGPPLTSGSSGTRSPGGVARLWCVV